MSKQKVKVLTVARNVTLQRRSDGGAYTATNLTYQDSSGKVVEKPFANSHLEKHQTLDQQLAALSNAQLPIDVVLEISKSPGKDGKMYNQISAILPGNTVIQPGEEVVASTYQSNRGSNFSGGNKTADFRSSKVITRTEALKVAVELAKTHGVPGITVDQLLAGASKIEEFINEADGNVSKMETSAPVVTTAENPFKF